MPNEEQIQALLLNEWQQQADVQFKVRVRRMLVSRDRTLADSNATGVYLPRPFNNTSLAIRTMLGEASKAVHVATSRITANPPVVSVVPLVTQNEQLSVKMDRLAGQQERMDNELLFSAGGPDLLWESAWAKCLGGASFWLILPRDQDFGLPTREYYSEDELAGKTVSRIPYGATTDGKFVYAERGDVWAARRKEFAKQRAIDGECLFTIQTYARDMVLKQRDREAKDLKWAAIVEEIPLSSVSPGTPFALSIAKAKGLTDAEARQWGIFYDPERKQIVGGIPRGNPVDSNRLSVSAFTLIRFFDREEQVIMVGSRGTVGQANEVWRGRHGCTVQGRPACPVVEDPFYRTDTNVPGKEYATVLDPVFGYIPSMNQLLTLESNVATFNGIPRFVMEMKPGDTMLRATDGNPTNVDSAVTPGLNPEDIAAYPGTVKQLIIDDEALQKALALYFARLDSVMPSAGTEAGADAAAWAIQQRNQESQAPYRKAVENGCEAIRGVVQRAHGWLRDLDTPIYFYAAPTEKRDAREVRGLIEFEPKNLTDSIKVAQNINTPSEATVQLQMGMELWRQQLIDDEEFYRDYKHELDVHDAVIRRWVQVIVNYVMTGALPPPPPGATPGPAPIVQLVADGVRGQVHYELIQQSDNYAMTVARQMAGQAQQQLAQPENMQYATPGSLPYPQDHGQQPPNVASAAQINVPGQGLTMGGIQQQLGNRINGANAPQQPAGVGV